MTDVPPLVDITAVEIIGDHALRLTFADGTVGDVVFEDREWRGVLAPLRDPARFAEVGIAMGTLSWPRDLDMAPEPLYAEALANRWREPIPMGITAGTAAGLHSWRITHYDPELRETGGDYGEASWIAVSDIGQEFGGVVLTKEAYDAVESAHIAAVFAFAREANITELEIRDSERGTPPDGTRVGVPAAAEIVRRMLREEAWCRVESPNDDFYVHVGWDYYMYVGAPRDCPNAVASTSDAGLFPESIDMSPYVVAPGDLDLS